MAGCKPSCSAAGLVNSSVCARCDLPGQEASGATQGHRPCPDCHPPSPSLSKRAKASLNSAICSSERCSAILLLLAGCWGLQRVALNVNNQQLQEPG
jgi:hypothetical protein